MDASEPIDLCESARAIRKPGAIGNVVAFGGLRPQGGYVTPAFEFVRTLADLNFNVLFVRDLSQRWFNEGLRDFSSNMQETEAKIGAAVADLFPSLPLYTIGNSCGGYASIYFGERLGADVVLAIVPQTLIGHQERKSFNETRWSKELDSFSPAVPNLRPHLHGRAKRIEVLTGSLSPFDMIHAGNIASAPNVSVNWIKAKHDVATHIQESEGGLAEYVRDRLIGPAPDKAAVA